MTETTPTTARAETTADTPEVRASAPPPPDGGKTDPKGECQCFVCRTKRTLGEIFPDAKVEAFTATVEPAPKDVAVSGQLLGLIREVRELASHRTTGANGLRFADGDKLTNGLQGTYESGLSDALAGLTAAAGALTVLSTLRTMDARR